MKPKGSHFGSRQGITVGVRAPFRRAPVFTLGRCRRCRDPEAYTDSNHGLCRGCLNFIRKAHRLADYPWAHTIERVLGLSPIDRGEFWRWIVRRVAGVIGVTDTANALRGMGVHSDRAPAVYVVTAVKIFGYLAWIANQREDGIYDDLSDDKIVAFFDEATEEAARYAAARMPADVLDAE